MSATFKLELLRPVVLVEDMPIVDNSVFVETPVFTRPSFLGTINDIKVMYAKRIGEDE